MTYAEPAIALERLQAYLADALDADVVDAEFETVRDELADEYVELEIVEDIELYCVLKDQYDEYADTLRDAVAHWERADHRFFLLSDELAVKEAVERGATRLTETDLVLGL